MHSVECFGNVKKGYRKMFSFVYPSVDAFTKTEKLVLAGVFFAEASLERGNDFVRIEYVPYALKNHSLEHLGGDGGNRDWAI